MDIFEEVARFKKAVLNNNYFFTYESQNDCIEIFKENNEVDFGLCILLEQLDYAEFFLEDYDLLEEFSSLKRNNEAHDLFIEVHNSYPGLINISYSGENDDFTMNFNTGAEISLPKKMIEFSHLQALKKKE